MTAAGARTSAKRKPPATPAAEFQRGNHQYDRLPRLDRGHSVVSFHKTSGTRSGSQGRQVGAAAARRPRLRPPIGNPTGLWQDTVALTANRWEGAMSVARVTEIISSSDKSFEDAVKEGIARASQTLENIREAWIASQRVVVENGKIVEYRVTLNVTFVLR
jgi:flavin-binding protein dodecin